jgi:hypothetical protein
LNKKRGDVGHSLSMYNGFASLIHEHTGGNPFFIEEVCTALTEEGTVRLEGRQAAFMSSLEQLSLLATVQAVLSARLDRLDHNAKEVLQLASVIGREFALRILERILDSNERLTLHSSRSLNFYYVSTFTGFTCQILSQYCRMVRSEEKKPQRAVLSMDMRVHDCSSR